MLAYWLRLKLLNAIPQSAVNDYIGTCTLGGGDALAFEGRPLSQDCRGVKVNAIRIVHDPHLVQNTCGSQGCEPEQLLWVSIGVQILILLPSLGSPTGESAPCEPVFESRRLCRVGWLSRA